MIDKTYLESVCAAQSLPFSPELSEKLDQYAQLLVEWNEKMNLTAIGAKRHCRQALRRQSSPFKRFEYSQKRFLDRRRHRRRFSFRSGWAGASGSESDSSG